MYLNNKGQASAELIFVTLIVIIIIGGLVTMVSGEMNKTQTGDIGQARMTGEQIAEVMNTVYTNGNGYSINLNLPDNFDFTAAINNSTKNVTITTFGQNINIKIIANDFQTVTNMSPGQRYQIKNVNGTITIKQI